MAFLDKLPYTTFFINGKDEILVKDVIRAVSLDSSDYSLDSLLIDYEMHDGEKIENISYSIYGSTEYHWVILFFNNRKDHVSEFPLTYEILMKVCLDQFGDAYATHHFENPQGEEVDFLTFPSYPVSNIEYMVKENDKKRNIKLLRKEYLSEFVKAYQSSISS